MQSTSHERAGPWLRLIALGLVAVWPAAGTRPASAEQPASAPPSAVETAAGLIPQLGSELFAVRESTANQLIGMGIEIKPALVAAGADVDPEIRMRVRRILAVVVAADFQNRLALFADDVNDTKHYDFPGWSRFRQLVGSDRRARSLFVEMQQAEAELMASLAAGPAAAERTLESRIYAAQLAVEARKDGRGDPEVLGSDMALLFVGSDKSVNLTEDYAFQLGSLANQKSFAEAIAASRLSELQKKILGLWIARDAKQKFPPQKLRLAMRFNLKEGLDPAIRVLQDGKVAATGKSVAMLTIAKFGGPEHLGIVEPFMSVTEICGQTGTDGTRYTVQVRDVALYTSLRLVQQDPKNFGFSLAAPPNEQGELALIRVGNLGFKSNDERDEAFKKWNDWRAAHPDSPDSVKAPAKP